MNVVSDRPRSRILAVRATAGSGVGLAVMGAGALVVFGHADFLLEGPAMFTVFSLGFGSLAWLAVPLRPGNRALWVPALASLLTGITVAGWAAAVLIVERSGIEVSADRWQELSPSRLPPAGAAAYQLVSVGPIAGFFLMLTLWLLLFPDGHFPSPRWRRVAWLAGALMIATTALLAWTTRPESTIEYGAPAEELPGVAALIEPFYVLLFLVAAACAVSLFSRMRRATGAARQQYRWVALGTVALLLAVFVVDPIPWKLLTALTAVLVAMACYGIAVTAFHLYDIDVVLSRTLVYGTLAGFIGAVYVAGVVVAGNLLGAGTSNLGLSLAVTALVAIAFEPVRRRARRWANRIVYGRRATPYEILATLTRRLAGTEPARGLLDRMARLMAEGTGAEQATVWLADDTGDLVNPVGWPAAPPDTQPRSFDALGGFVAPVRHDGRIVGALQILKPRGNPVTPAEARLVEDLAGSAGLVFGNQRLNAALASRAADLRASRRRLVEIQDAERRRLERDLHDGAQQQVIALKLKVGLAEHMARKAGAEGLADDLGALADEAQAAVDEVRTLARGIYPPLLESEGLAAAIRSQTDDAGVSFRSDGLGRYPKDVESAVYFAALEAVADSKAHGGAAPVDVSLCETDGELVLEIVQDDADPGTTGGDLGLTTVGDRLEALGGTLHVSSGPGGGRAVTVRIPLTDPAGPPGGNQAASP